MKINSNFQAFAAMNFDATKYVASPASGVQRFMLDRIGSEKARATTIVQYAPNSSFPEHTHIGGEEFVVLEGTFKDQYGDFPAGTYVRNPIGSKHAPKIDDDGCTIFVKLLQMAETPGEMNPLHIDLQKKSGLPCGDCGTVLQLYKNELTGEHVEMLWLKPDKMIPIVDVDDKTIQNGGEELFVIDGSLLLDQTEYSKWGWLRFPPNENGYEQNQQRKLLKSGTQGAQIYRKTGHLTAKALAMEKIQIKDEE